MIAVKHHGARGLHIIVNAAPADLTRRLVVRTTPSAAAEEGWLSMRRTIFTAPVQWADYPSSFCFYPTRLSWQPDLPCCHISSCLRELFATEGRACARVTPRTLQTLQVLPNQLCTRISFFFSKTVWEIRDYFLATTKIQLKRVNHKLSRRTIDAPWTGRVREASSGPQKIWFSTA